jgi:hypothetical protein
MNRINEFKIEPGTYRSDDSDTVLVVVDVVNHMYNSNHNLQEALSDPLVILRNIEYGKLEHNRYSIPLSIFKLKFKPV